MTTYEIKTAAGFTGLTHLLTLNQDLVADYFVMLRGAAGDYTSGGDRGPAADYARIDRDPHGNFTGEAPPANQIRLGRGSSTGTWTGQVTVAECIADCAASGFTLVRVNEVTMTSGQTLATDLSGGVWGSGNLDQIGLYGGSYGGGMEATDHARADAGGSRNHSARHLPGERHRRHSGRDKRYRCSGPWHDAHPGRRRLPRLVQWFAR